jgi:peptidoglycan/xylan/chitin deacetylase (PgdA/CDA1 family)
MDRLTVLNYHHVHDGPDAFFRITPARLEAQLRALLQAGFTPVALGDLDDSLPERPLLVTFDDGYEDFFIHAWPILRALRVPATVFVISGAIGRSNDWDDASPARHRHLSREQLTQLVREGVTVGSHSATHANLTQLDDAALEAEIAHSQQALQGLLGIPVRAFAYPGGHRDRRVKTAVARHYDLGFGTDGTPDDRYDVPRFDPSFSARLEELQSDPWAFLKST